MLRCHVLFLGNLHAFISQSGNNQIAFNQCCQCRAAQTLMQSNHWDCAQ